MKLICTCSESEGKNWLQIRIRKKVKENRIIKTIPVSTPLWMSVGGLLLTVCEPAGEFTNERQNTCVDIALNDCFVTPPGCELWILCSSSMN